MLRWPLLRLLRAPDDIIRAAASYLGVYTLGFAPSFIYNVASSILRGLGDSRSPLRFLTYATVMNIVLDPIMIFGLGPIPRMEVAGAAWATVISQVFAASLALAYMIGRLKIGTRLRDLARLDWNLTSLTVKIGLPAGAQQTLVSLGMMVIMSTVNQFGSVVVAGSGVGSRLEQFGHLPAFSVGLAVTALVGQNLGAGRDDRVSEVVKWGLLLTCSITALTPVVQAFPTADCPFTKILRCLRPARLSALISLGFVPAAMFALTGVLRGAGDTLPTVITLGSLWLVGCRSCGCWLHFAGVRCMDGYGQRPSGPASELRLLSERSMEAEGHCVTATRRRLGGFRDYRRYSVETGRRTNVVGRDSRNDSRTKGYPP